jgi:O-antigen/teichoic acid export membrane protein
VLRIVFLWVPLGWHNTMTGQTLMAAGHQRAHLLVATVSAVCTAVLLVGLVSLDGARGAGLAVAITEVITCIGFTIACRRLLGMTLIENFFRQGLYFLVPLAVMLTVDFVAHGAALFAGAILSLLALLVFERLAGTSTLRLLIGAKAAATKPDEPA